MAAIRESTLTRLQIASLIALLVICAAAVVHEVYRSSDAPFLTRGSGAAWIGYPFPPSSDAIPVLRDNIAAYSFVKRFEIAQHPGPPQGRTILTARGLSSLELSLNGATLLWDPPRSSWKEKVEVDITEKLRPGGNQIRARVRNATGPALLQLAIHGEAIELETDGSWEVTAPGVVQAQAAPARDNQLFAESFIMPGPTEVLDRKGLILGALFLIFAGVSAGLRTRAGDLNLARLPNIVLGGVTLYWLAVFVVKISQLPVMMGFDIPAHLAYFDYLIENRSLPSATESWSTYHPPLFYLLTSSLVVMFDVVRESTAGQVVYRIVCFGSGLSMIWAAHFCARRFFRGDPVRTSLATGFVGLLPMNLYVSAYVSNESLLAAWISVGILVTCDALMSERTSLRHLLAVGAAFGFAIMTKFSGLILVPVVAGVIGVKIALLEGDGRRAASLRGAVACVSILATAALLGGWFYLRNYLAHGEWVIWNVNLPGEMTWWEYPGFHTAAYYLGFGEVFRHPFFAGFYSFWDGLYSTFWGDGLLAGMVHVETRHPQWNYDFMTLGYWTALPATVAIAIGAGRLIERAFRDDSLHLRITSSFLFLVVFVLLFSLFIVTFRVPYYAQAKAFYALGAALPVSIAAANGFAMVDEALRSTRAKPLRLVFHAWLGTAAAVIVLTYLG